MSVGNGKDMMIGFEGLAGLWRWHRALVARLEELMLAEQEAANGGAESEGDSERPLRQSLKDCFLLLGPTWESEGVWLVFRDITTAETYVCSDEAQKSKFG